MIHLPSCFRRAAPIDGAVLALGRTAESAAPAPRRILAVVAAAACAALLVPASRAATPPDVPASLRALLDAAGRGPVDAEATFSDVEALLATAPQPLSTLEDGETLPEARPELLLEPLGALSCGTPVMRAAGRAMQHADPERQHDLALLIQGPTLASERAYVVAGEGVTLHYDVSVASRHAVSRRDADRDQVPDVIAGLADDVRLSSRRLTELTGWSHRWSGGGLDIVLADTPFAEGATSSRPRQLVTIPRDARGPARLEAVAHQMAHALVHEMAPGAPDAWEEAVATWLGESVLAAVEGLDVPSSELLPRRHPDRALLSPGLQSARGDAEFLRYLSTEAGLPLGWLGEALAAFPRHLDDALRTGRLSPADAPASAVAESLDEVLGHHGSSLAEGVAGYQSWTLETDLLLRGAQASVDAELDVLPVDEARPERLAPFGQLRFGVQVPAGGGLKLGFGGDERLQAVAVALLDDGTVRRFPLSSGGGARLALAASRLQRVIVLVQSPLIPAEWSVRQSQPAQREDADDLTLQAIADPSYPFLLRAQSTEVAPGQVTLSWDTASEDDIVGWYVERAMRPSGPFLRVSDVPLPALSWPGTPASYAFVDATVRPGSRYHYRVEAVTSSGLLESTPATSVRTLPSVSDRRVPSRLAP